MSEPLVVRRAGGRLGAALRPYASWPLVGVPDLPPVLALGAAPVTAGGTGPSVAELGPEAVVALATAAGAVVVDGEPVAVDDPGDLLAQARLRGVTAVQAVRGHPDLLARTALGGWSRARLPARVLRRVLLAAPLLRRWCAASGRPAAARAAADAAYWAGARDRVDRREWQRLTRAYVTLCYHRAAGEMLPGQERWDVAPQVLARQLRTLRRWGWRPLGPDDLLAIHAPGLDGPAPPRRGVVVTFDDGYADAVDAARDHAGLHPHVYVCTAEVGTDPAWASGAPLAGWDDVRAAAGAGVVVGSHARRHVPLTEVPPERRDDQLAGSADDLRRELGSPFPAVAYPNGRHDADVLTRAERAGYLLGHTTVLGRNGAGTPPLQLRRVSPKQRDRALTMLWIGLTGERPHRRLGG